MSKELIIMGAGGHATVVLEAIRLCGQHIIKGFTTREELPNQTSWEGITWIGNDASISRFEPESVTLVNGIGSAGKTNAGRIALYTNWKSLGYEFGTIIHPTAFVSPNSTLSDGVQVMAGAVIQPRVRIGANSIINTRAVLDHHCMIESHVHIAPAAVLCGQVRVGEGAHIGAGATVKQGVHIGRYSVIGAGAVVLHNVPERSTVVGVPAKEVRG